MAPGLADNSTAQNGNSNFEELLPDDDDLLYEEELLRNPYSLRMWWRYLEARKDAAQKRRFLLYERAISALPGSYKVSFPVTMQALCHLQFPAELSCSAAALACISEGATCCDQGPAPESCCCGGSKQHIREGAGLNAQDAPCVGGIP